MARLARGSSPGVCFGPSLAAKEASPHAGAALPAPSEQPSTEFAARAKATWARLIRRVYEADPVESPSARGRCASSRLNRGSGSHPRHPRAPGPVGAAGDATKSATGSRGLAGAPQPATHLPPGSRHRLGARRRAPRLTWRARGLHNLPQCSLRSAPAARIGRWSTRGQPRSRAIGRTEHRSGVTAALHWHRTPATGALIFLFLDDSGTQS